MTTDETPELPEASSVPVPAPASRLEPRKRRWLRKIGMLSVFLLVLVSCVIAALYLWVSSAAFEDNLRRRVIGVIEQATGGRVEIASFHWDVMHLSLETDGITIHGLEAATEAPYAHIERLRVEAGIFGLFVSGVSPRIILHSVEADQPSFHLVVYPDGSTNQPRPRTQPKSGKPVLDTLFDARIGQLTVRQGSVHIANQVIPLDFAVHDAGVELTWLSTIGPAPNSQEVAGTYRIAVDLGEISFIQGPLVKTGKPFRGHVHAIALLSRNSLQLESVDIGAFDQILSIRGHLNDFAHPAWQAQLSGKLDVRVLEPSTTFDAVRGGIVALDAVVSGKGANFESDGHLNATDVHYQDLILDARTPRLTARFHANEKQLLVSNIRTRLLQGGDVNGDFKFDNWLESTVVAGSKEALELRRLHQVPLIPTAIIHGNLSGVTLDTMLILLAGKKFQRLGLDTVVNGPVTATWTGMAYDLAIGGQLALAPTGHALPGEAPVAGSVDGTFHANAGAIEVRTMDVRLPRSAIRCKGIVGVFPITRASDLELDFESTDLNEFDAILQALELRQGSRIGSAALPARLGSQQPSSQTSNTQALSGRAEFHGRLTSSWIKPHVDGHLTGTNIAIEIPSTDPNPDAKPRFVSWDAMDVDGLYTPASITVRRGVLNRGSATLTVEGHVDSHDLNYDLTSLGPEFDGNSLLRVRADAQQFPLDDLLPILGVIAPVTGKLNAHLELQGLAKAVNGSGSIDVTRATVFGEQVDHLRASGTVASSDSGQMLKITSLSAEQAGGRLSATGVYDLVHHNFQVDARGIGMEVGSFQRVKSSGLAVSGKLGFTVTGEGTLDDPRLQILAVLGGMNVAGESVADLRLSARTGQHKVTYDISSKQPAGDLSAHGETELNAEYQTKASLQLSKFDIGALLKLLHVTGINGQSDIEGTAQLSGPLAHPEKMSGAASLRELAVVIQGVHLQSQGAAHATLTNGVARLDPIEITGEDTDLKLFGTLAIAGKQQLDLQANGSVNLRLAVSMDPDLIASGVTSFQMEAHGPLANPVLQGKVEFKNAALALQDFPNGLSQINGTLEFIQNRLQVRSLTAVTGGGQLSLAGYLGFQRGIYSDLTATGKGIRIRYPQGVSSLADATFHLQGPQSNLLLSGNAVVTRFAINADLDIAAIAAQSSVAQPLISPDAPSNHVRLDVHLTSAPQLNFQNAYAKLAGDVDLHLRGTIASPSLLGRISLAEGSTSIGGTRYELQRGDINFNNPVRIQPNIDLDATARVEDYDITLGLHGTTDKLNVTYRSEPPLPEADVIALLALGRTQNEQPAYSQQQQQAGDNPTTDLLLGGALNATVSNRVQRLFGSGAVKVDPNFIGSIGNSSARVTVVEQIGNNLTFTFASNVNTTAQQLIQAEIAINRHVSLLVTQDESGIFSVVVKARRRYR